MPKFRKTLILLTAPAVLASCVAQAPNECAGWRKITGAGSSVEWLAQNDPQMLRGVIGHNETGKAQGCW